MDRDVQMPAEELQDLKQRIADAVRKTLWEMADERGMSVSDFIDSLVERKMS
jgi:hypothetical protein